MKKLTAVLVALTVLCGVMVVVSSNYSVARTRDAIVNLPKAEATDACAATYDTADKYYDKMTDYFLFFADPLTDGEKQAFLEAKVDFLRVQIKAAVTADQRKDTDGLTKDEVKKMVDDTTSRLEEYLTEDQYSLVPNYSDLQTLQTTYADSASSSGEEAQVQLC